MLILRNYQKEAIENMTKNNRCLLVAPTGSGKTIIIIGLTEKINCKTLILVPTIQLINQTIEKYEQFINIKPIKFNNKKRELGNITVSTWQSMTNALSQGFLPEFEMIIADESHGIGEETNYYKIINILNPKYFYAVTATPYRYDDILPLKELCNMNEYKIDIEMLYQLGYLIRPEITFIKTNFSYNIENELNQWEKLNLDNERKANKLKIIIGQDKKRNNFILNQIYKLEGKNTIVLSYTKDQTDYLYNNYQPKDFLRKKYLIHGDFSKKERIDFFEEIKDKENFIIFATQSFLGEGIDIPQLDTLFVTTPLGGKSRPIQYAGRILRPYQNKITAKIYDFVDNYENIGKGWQYIRKKYYKTLNPVFNNDIVKDELYDFKVEYNNLIKRIEKAEDYFEKNPNAPEFYYLEYKKILNRIAEIIKICGQPENTLKGYIL